MFQCNFQFLTIQNDIRKCTKTLKEIHDIKYLYLSSVCMHERIVSWSIFENIFPLIPFNLGADILLLIAGLGGEETFPRISSNTTGKTQVKHTQHTTHIEIGKCVAYVRKCGPLPLAGGLIKQTTAAADWSVRLQRICRSQCEESIKTNQQSNLRRGLFFDCVCNCQTSRWLKTAHRTVVLLLSTKTLYVT